MSLAVDFNAATFYLGTDYGVYSTGDSGTRWVPESTNLPSVAVYDAQIDVPNGYIVAATHGRGMWRALLSGGVSLRPRPLTTAPTPENARRTALPDARAAHPLGLAKEQR